MAGSYRHVADWKTGEFKGLRLVENGIDRYEAIEECVDMIQFLTGGDPRKIHEAWLMGHCMKRIPQRVQQEPQLFDYEDWSRDDD